MAKTKKIEHPFTVVYVYAPEQYKADYMAGKTIPRVKIGETYADADDCQTCMEASMKRINQQSTSFDEYNYLLQWFVFPYKEGTDIAIRKILTEPGDGHGDYDSGDLSDCLRKSARISEDCAADQKIGGVCQEN